VRADLRSDLVRKFEHLDAGAVAAADNRDCWTP
jgi:hypothetical protein